MADQYQYQVVLVEPKTAWRLDCAQLKEKNQWQLSLDDLKKLKPGLEKDFLPLYFGWFLTKRVPRPSEKPARSFWRSWEITRLSRKSFDTSFLGMNPRRSLTWSATLARDLQACCTVQPNSVTTGRPPGQKNMPNRMW